jgi:hypothetical protein
MNYEEIYSVVLCELKDYSPGLRIKQSSILEIKYTIVTMKHGLSSYKNTVLEIKYTIVTK